MPGWIAVVPIPEPDDPTVPCASCGRVHEPGEQHAVQVGPFLMAVGENAAVKIVRAIVLEVGQVPGDVIPFEKDSTVYFTGERGTLIGGVLFMLAQNVICWDEQ